MAAGITPPWPGLKALWDSRATVAQALRMYPQYNAIDMVSDWVDHKRPFQTYHAAVIRLEKHTTRRPGSSAGTRAVRPE